MSHLTHEKSARERREFALKLKRVEEAARKKAIRERERFIGLQIAPTGPDSASTCTPTSPSSPLSY
jgi:hypothetical protein